MWRLFYYPWITLLNLPKLCFVGVILHGKQIFWKSVHAFPESKRWYKCEKNYQQECWWGKITGVYVYSAQDLLLFSITKIFHPSPQVFYPRKGGKSKNIFTLYLIGTFFPSLYFSFFPKEGEKRWGNFQILKASTGVVASILYFIVCKGKET